MTVIRPGINRAASASTDGQAYLGAAAFTDAGYKLIAVTYRHGHIRYRFYGERANTTMPHANFRKFGGLVISSQYILFWKLGAMKRYLA